MGYDNGLTIKWDQISKLGRKQMVHIKLTHQNTISYSNLSIALQLIIKTTIMSQNPYQKIYDDLNITITPDTTLAQAQTLARHLGYLYNTFGLMVKDFVSLLGYRFRTEHPFLNDKNKKDRKNHNFQPRTDKKARSQDEMEDQQLEGKSIPAPPNNPYQFQMHNQPGKSPNAQLPAPSQPKNTHLSNSNQQPNQNSSNALQKESPKSPLPTVETQPKNPQTQRKNLQTQSKDPSTLNPPKPSQTPDQTTIRKIIPRRKRDHEVINISSEDEQKQEDSLSGVKTRAQHRGENRENKQMMRPDSLLRRGRGRGRARRGRPSSRSSSRMEDYNQDDKKSLSSYPLHPSDPFTVIHNVPYRPSSKILNNLSPGSTPSKKDQKLQKQLEKQMSQSSQSQGQYEGQYQPQSKQMNPNQNKGLIQVQNQDQSVNYQSENRSVNYQSENRSNRSENRSNRSENRSENRCENYQSERRSPYNNESFIKKVMSSYLQEKEQIREKLDNLNKEYQKQNIHFTPNRGQDNNSNNDNNGKQMQNSRSAQQLQDDGYEYEVEEEVSFEQVPQQDNFGDQEIMQEEHEQIQMQMHEYEQEVLPFQKLNPSPKPSPKPRLQQNPQNSYNYLQQINQSIQQQFQQNLRMNHQIDHSDQYEEQEISYSSPPNCLIDDEQDQYEPVVVDSRNRNQQQLIVGENVEENVEENVQENVEENVQAEMGEIMIEKQSGKVIEGSQENIKSGESQQNRQYEKNQQNNHINNNGNSNSALFDSLFQYQSNQPQPNQMIQLDQNLINNQNQSPQRKPSNTQPPHHLNINQLPSQMEPQRAHNSSPIQQYQSPQRKNSTPPQSQKPIVPAQSYFPFLQGIPNPENNQINCNQINNQEISHHTDQEVSIIQNNTISNKESREANSSDKEELLKVLDAFESDEEQPKRDINKPPVTPDLRQALIDKLTLMKQKQLKSGNLLTTIKQSTTSTLEKPPLSNSPLRLQNSSIHQNKPLLLNPTDNKPLPPTDQEKPTTTAIKESTNAGVVTTKPVDQPIPDNKKQNPPEFVSFPKKAKYIEVIELQ